MSDYPTVPLAGYEEYPVEEMRRRAEAFYAEVDRRRTVREFSDRPVPREIIENALKAGFAHKEWLENDTDLDPIRDTDRFRQLVGAMG